MSAYQQTRVDNVLPKALDLDRVGKPQDAFNLLVSSLTIRRNVRAWSELIEEAIFKFVELAVRLRAKQNEIRNVLHTYKSSTTANPSLFIKVVQHLVDLTDAAVSKSIKASISDAETISPEQLALYAFGGVPEEVAKVSDVNTARDHRFFWETYRTIFSLLQQGTKFQDYFHKTIGHVYDICLQHESKTDFRRFFTLFRDFTPNRTPSSVNTQIAAGEVDPVIEGQRLTLKTFYTELSTAISLELWEEAIQTIDDIVHCLRSITSNSQINTIILQIFEKLTTYFWNSDNYLFYAYSLVRLQRLRSEDPIAHEAAISELNNENSFVNASNETIFANVVLSALLISPHESNEANLMGDPEFVVRFAPLLNLADRAIPSRTHLISLIEKHGILAGSTNDIRIIYKNLEHQTSPLNIKKNALPALSVIRADKFTTKFATKLTDLVVIRVLERLGQVYTVVSFEHFYSLVPDVEPAILEKFILKAINGGAVNVRISHRDSTLNFYSPSLESRTYVNKVNDITNDFSRILDMLTDVPVETKQCERDTVFSHIRSQLDEENINTHNRKEQIRLRKENEELLAREKEAKRKADEKARLIAKQEADEKAKAEHIKKLEDEEKQRRKEQLDLEKKQEMAEALMNLVTVDNASKIVKEASSLAQNVTEVTQEELIEMARKVELQKRAEVARKAINEFKSIDYYTRACRILERDIFTKDHEIALSGYAEKSQLAREKFYDDHKTKYEKDLLEKSRLARLLPKRDAFVQKLKDSRREKYEAELAIYNEKKEARDQAIKAEKIEAEAKRLEELKLQDERRENAIAAQRKSDEEARRRFELEEKMEREDRAKASAKPNTGGYVPPHLRKK